MGHYFKFHGNARELWENREALEMYLARLKELMEADEKEKLPAETDSLSKDEDVNSPS